ncbi:MAG: Spi family protease inhibitor, partial [Bacteroidales bacterium]|nr:Spi family protease inhibitor [Bacteroidales bacterium]
MRKTFFVLAFLLAVLPLRAERVPVEKAQVVARAVFQHDRNAALRMAPLRQVELASAPRTKAGEERPAFYIFNRAGGGFVIVAGEDVCTPVLAYSYTNRFETGDDMPANLKEWLGELETLVA